MSEYDMMGMPDISGTTWWSRTGQDHFTVRDVIMDPSSGMMITTTDGRMINMDRMDNYIQSDKPVGFTKRTTPRVDVRGLDSETPVQVEEWNEPIAEPMVETPMISTNHEIIQRAMSEVSKPTVRVSLEFEVYPERELSVLRDVMKVPEDEILDYCYKTWFSSDLDESIKSQLRELLSAR